tara:strand:+ start:370 stop:819 length:450 start_codon:yes stop_codon:yes gene_type:complete
MATTQVSVMSQYRAYQKLVSKTYGTNKGRNTVLLMIHSLLHDIESLVNISEQWIKHDPHMMDIKRWLNHIRCLFYIMNGNRLGAEKAQNKVELSYMEELDRLMFPTQPRDDIPEQHVIKFGEEAKIMHQWLNRCMDNIDIISNKWINDA